jgi:hypothetical protein
MHHVSRTAAKMRGTAMISVLGRLVGAAILLGVAPSLALAADPPPPPANGSQTGGPTQYYPVTGNPSGTSVGVTVTPNPGTPSTPPSSTYGAGVQFPIPGGK